jgi:predicted alpha/beta superfamily hydrolase
MRRSQRVLERLVASLVVLLAAPAAAQSAAPAESSMESQGEPVIIGERFHFESKVLNETRRYIVHKPSGYDFSNERYAVIVLLDGDANISHVSASADLLAQTGRAMPMIVVGIENTDRQRDLTPPITRNLNDHPSGKVGGAKRFLSFIADELIPHLDRTYRTRPTRILIGHSYGGLFVVYTLFNRPDVFKAYIAVSPSLWWDDQAMAKQADKFVAEHKDLRAAMYMTMANEDGPMLGGAQKVIGSLASAPGTISATFQHWPEESHGSIVLRSVYEGLEWLSEIYYTHDPIRVYEESGLNYFDKKFALISEYLGYEVKIPEHVLMHIQHYLAQKQRPEEALAVLLKVLQLYPGRPAAHYELGRAYLQTENRAQAVQEFKRTLELYPGNSDARSALEKLGFDPQAIVTDATKSPAELRGYVGEYRYSDEISQVTSEDGKLFIKVRNDRWELRARSDGTFYTMDADREYTFHKKSGRVVSATVQLAEFSYESQKVK